MFFKNKAMLVILLAFAFLNAFLLDSFSATRGAPISASSQRAQQSASIRKAGSSDRAQSLVGVLKADAVKTAPGGVTPSSTAAIDSSLIINSPGTAPVDNSLVINSPATAPLVINSPAPVVPVVPVAAIPTPSSNVSVVKTPTPLAVAPVVAAPVSNSVAAASTVADSSVGTTQAYRDLLKCMDRECFKDDFAPKYYNCFLKNKFENTFLACQGEITLKDSEKDVSMDAIQQKIQKLIDGRKEATCTTNNGRWVKDKNTCEYKITYTREGDKVEKYYPVGKRILCSYVQFGLPLKREPLPADPNAKLKLLTMAITAAPAMLTLASSVSFKTDKQQRENIKKETDEANKNADSEYAQKAKLINDNTTLDTVAKNRKLDELYSQTHTKADYSSVKHTDVNGILQASTALGGLAINNYADNLQRNEQQAQQPLILGKCEYGNGGVIAEDAGANISITWFYN